MESRAARLFFESWQAAGDSWSALLECKKGSELRHQVEKLDPDILKAAFFTGDFDLEYTCKHMNISGAEWRCNLVDNHGILCTDLFDTKRQLAVHQSRAARHRLPHPVLSTIVGNMCPNCGSVLSSEWSVRCHLTSAYRTGCCNPGLSKYEWDFKRHMFLGLRQWARAR